MCALLLVGTSAPWAFAVPSAAAHMGSTSVLAAARSATGDGDAVATSWTLATIRGERLGATQWGLRAIGAEGAWGITRGSGVTIAILDSGIDDNHPDLAGRLLRARDLVGDGMEGDPFGHGTRIAGIIAAAMDGAGIAGVASDVRVLPIRVLAANGEGYQRRTARGIREAVDAGAQVINLSLSSQTPHQSQASAIQYALDKGVTVVAAAGNRRRQGSPTVYPAAYPGVIGVSSVSRSLKGSPFASRGGFIDIVAPGQRILTTQPGGGWVAEDGTSLAAAFVAASAALVRAANPSLDRARVEQILLSTTRDLGARGRDDLYGQGLLQVDRAVRAAASAPGGALVPTVQIAAGSTASGSKLRVDLGPDLAAGAWQFRVQRQRADGSWRTLRSTYRTRGATETRVLNLPAGTYRVRVASRFGLRATTSATVVLTR